jgi:hypothetical protein
MSNRARRGRRIAGLVPALSLVACLLTVAPLAWPATPKSRPLSASADLRRIAKPGPLSAVQSGPIRGTPFGTGMMVLRSTLKLARVNSTFTVTTKAGKVAGRATARLTLDGDTATYKGTASVTSGTGRYRRARGQNITFSGVGPVSAASTKISLSGRVRY